MRAVVKTQADLYRFCEKAVDMLDGRPKTVTIKQFHRPRSIEQNAKLHAMIRDLADHTGHSTGELKEMLKAEYLPMRMIQVGSVTRERPQSTADLTVAETSDFIERIYKLGAEVGCVFQDG